MQYTITIDTGTSNTRTYLWDGNRELIASAKSEVGVHVTAMEGHNGTLKAAIRDCLAQLLEQGGIGFDAVSQVLASGMITSNVGLCEIPHVYAPAGREELAAGSVLREIKDVCPLPIRFIPGVKNPQPNVDAENFEAMDMMRGEEVETLAILNSFPKDTPYLLVLPGSHTKFVSVDASGKITGCLTTITGELLDCMTNHTVIADAVGRQFVSEENYDRDMVLKGFDTASRTGLGRAAFSARILNTFAEKDKQKLANYLLGAALSSDVQSIRNSAALKAEPTANVIVSGKNPLRRAIVDVLTHDGYFANVQEYIPDPNLPLSASGAFCVADALREKEEKK